MMHLLGLREEGDADGVMYNGDDMLEMQTLAEAGEGDACPS
jgi:hypothetical protein